MAESTTTVGAPDWTRTIEELECPLCGYNLRGLIEPRCPECGYRFEWNDLLDPTRRAHPYLFEHHPERNVWSYARTLSGSLALRRFWTSLDPRQPSSPRRLILYWAVPVILLTIGLSAMTIISAVNLGATQAASRAAFVSQMQSMMEQEWVKEEIRAMGSLEALADDWYPVRPIWHDAWIILSMDDPPLFVLAAVVLIWPALTLAVLLAFRWSMRRARVRPVHVLRCVAYSMTPAMWCLAVGWAGIVTCRAVLIGAMGKSTMIPIGLIGMVVIMAASLYWFFGLRAVYKHYLKFDRPTLTVFASQLIIALALLNAYLIWSVWGL